MPAYNAHDVRRKARQRLPRGLFDFVDRGAEDEFALDANRQAFRDIKLVPRVLANVSGRDPATSLFGQAVSAPIVVAPTGAAGLLWFEGEIALARAAAKAGLPFTLATGSLTAMERVAAEAGGNLWFQLYMWPDRSMSHALVERARKAGFKALVVTVDTAVPSNREYNLRSGFTVPFRFTSKNIVDVALHPRWLCGVLGRYLLTTGMPRYRNYPTDMQQKMTAAPMGKAMPKADSLSWDDLRDLRRLWSGQLLIKGVLHPADAEAAVACGVDGIIVSNHGGRVLDAAIPPVMALPAILERVAGRVPVLLDSGITRGSDVVKALALGAKAVLVGRAPLWGVATGGQAGAEQILAILKEETRRVMGQVGSRTVDALSRDVLCMPHAPGPAATA
ncbi:alpha-hydroxy acid oxidase [Humitalea sp. 24SJ18S-53]|uniref:alpha-hydroxy acid oxidase n=1 Tax=Humitalea sp. 24SJ18S-53 TaxID=3422307 RepID=UPI003D67F115